MLRGLQHTPRWPYRSLALASQRSTMAAAEPPQMPHIIDNRVWGRKFPPIRELEENKTKTYYLRYFSLDTSQCCDCCSY